MATLSRRQWLELLDRHVATTPMKKPWRELTEREPACATWIPVVEACAKSPAGRAESLRRALGVFDPASSAMTSLRSSHGRSPRSMRAETSSTTGSNSATESIT